MEDKEKLNKLVDKMIKEEIGGYIWSLIQRTNPKYVRNAIERGIVEGWRRGYGEARDEYMEL